MKGKKLCDKKERKVCMDVLLNNLPLLIPILLIQIILMTVALIDLKKRKRVRFNNKLIWVFIIVLINLLGPIIYFVARGEEHNVCGGNKRFK